LFLQATRYLLSAKTKPPRRDSARRSRKRTSTNLFAQANRFYCAGVDDVEDDELLLEEDFLVRLCLVVLFLWVVDFVVDELEDAAGAAEPPMAS